MAEEKTTKKKPTSNKAKKKSPYGEGSLQVQGQPRRFKSDQELQDSFILYIQHCATKQFLPNISGFCVYIDITTETFYQQKNYYPYTYRKIRQALEDSLIQYDKFTGMNNPTMAIMQGKNTFKWNDSGKSDDSSLIDVDFDADPLEIDNYMSKLGYLPSPEFSESE